MISRRAAAVTIGLVAALLYLPALWNGFAYDDVAIIRLDPRIHSLANAPLFFVQGYWADPELSLYRPLVTLSFAADWAIAPDNAAWFLCINLLWNAAACALAFLFMERFASIPAAMIGALLFAAHPVHVEAVANVVGRAELMAAVFLIGALLVWPARDASRPGRRHAVVALLFALALLAKESAIAFPGLLVLLDVARRDLVRGRARDWLRSRIAPLAVLAAIAVAYILVRAAVLDTVTPARVDPALEVTSGVTRLLTALQAWPHYVRLLLFPRTLLADYGPQIIMPVTGPTTAVVAGAAILLALVAGGAMAWLGGRGVAALILLWVPVALLPVSNLLVPVGVVVAERTLYLPSLALGAGVALAVDAFLHGRSAVRGPVRAGAGALVLVVLLAASARTLARIPDWHSTDTVMAALMRDRPDSYRAHWHHARLAAVANQPDSALARYAAALALWPYSRGLVLESARAAVRAGNVAYARGLAEFAHGRWPTDPAAARILAGATIDLGDTAAARLVIRDALRAIPGDSLLLRMQHAISNASPNETDR